MTRTYDGLVTCPSCGAIHTAETAFERWMRNERALDSRDGIVRFDCDVLLHRYKCCVDKKSTRDLQCLMFLEIKTFNAELSEAQRDTLSLMSQVLRNRRRNIHRDRRGRHAHDHDPLALAFSWLLGRDVRIRMFGGHLVRLSGADPLTSDRIEWDHRPITLNQLIALLRFELDPDSLSPIDWRRRYSAFDDARQRAERLGLISSERVDC